MRSDGAKPRGDGGAVVTFYRGCWGIVLGLASLFFRPRAEGQGHIPAAGGVILASNHCSYVDPVLIGLAAKGNFGMLRSKMCSPCPFWDG